MMLVPMVVPGKCLHVHAYRLDYTSSRHTDGCRLFIHAYRLDYTSSRHSDGCRLFIHAYRLDNTSSTVMVADFSFKLAHCRGLVLASYAVMYMIMLASQAGNIQFSSWLLKQ